MDSLGNLSGNVLCAIDCETTGRLAGYHEIIQVAFLPLDANLNPVGRPFYEMMRPLHPERAEKRALEVCGLDVNELHTLGPDPGLVQERLEEWIKDLNLPINRAIVPVAHNWAYDSAFLMDWLGLALYDTWFYGQARDTMAIAGYLNDISAYRSERIPFDRLSLKNVCEVLGVVNEVEHDALSDCRATAEVYKKLVSAIKMI